MIKKIFRRRVFVTEISQNNKVLGYYAGKDNDYHIIVKGLDDAIIFKTEKGVRHNVTHQEKYDVDNYSYRMVEAEEIQTTIYYDEYDKVNKKLKPKPFFVIRVKDKSDMLSEAKYIKHIDMTEGTFDVSLSIERALLMGGNKYWKFYKFLSKGFSKEFEFYKESVLLKTEKKIELINE